MTVGELIDALKGCDPTDIVLTDAPDAFYALENISKLRAVEDLENAGYFRAYEGPEDSEHDNPDVNYNAVVLS